MNRIKRVCKMKRARRNNLTHRGMFVMVSFLSAARQASGN
ncbi:hypothetical protein AQPE_0828 [Aquipluma nitroreducens]|uniref:Uncharacterized protein n=1 Tax=Aquipluma nitroreducens TaxID=2010828 RepID=A0A5K7S5D2_9BACT|nr:hypothetical protein AQPE_0828 [Aquipluma nitroreducens]